MKQIFLYILILSSTSIIGQIKQYVKAENGLIVREKPEKSSKRIGKLEYGAKVYILKQTENILEIVDEDRIIKGKWAQIQEINGDIKGYVFDGYLTLNNINDNLKIRFDEFDLTMRLSVFDKENLLNKIQKDTVRIWVDLGDSPQGKRIRISSLYTNIEILQRFENSLSITDEGAHCDLIQWRHYLSNWEPIKINNNSFVTNIYTRNDTQRFLEITVEELKKYVDENCAQKFSRNIQDIKKFNQYPSIIGISKIFLKIKLENSKTGEKKEKIILFEIPMGC